jgi:hypothetical protein
MSSLNLRKLMVRMTDNWVAKVLSVFLAMVVSLFHQTTSMETRSFLVPLRVELPSGLVPSRSYPRMIRVTLKGEADNIMSILEDDIKAFIDFTRVENPGSYRMPVQIRKEGSAIGVEPLETTPNPVSVELELDKKDNKSVPLRANIIQGSLEPGYDLSYSLSPAQVVLDGPARLLENVTELNTETIDLNGRTADFFEDVDILNPDPLLSIRGNGRTEFRGSVRGRVTLRTFDSLSITLKGLDERFSAEPDVALGTVRIEGPPAALDAFEPPDSLLTVDCAEITGEGPFTLPVMVDLPSPLKLVWVDPEEITVLASLSGEDANDNGSLPSPSGAP